MIVTLSTFDNWMAVPVTVFRPSVAVLMTRFVPAVPKVRPALAPVRLASLRPLPLLVKTLPEPMTAAVAGLLGQVGQVEGLAVVGQCVVA